MSAVSLINLYDQNEINTDDMFLNKKINVFGFAKDIGKDITGNMYITLMGGTQGYSKKMKTHSGLCSVFLKLNILLS